MSDTRTSMETDTEAERRRARFDALYAEAKQSLSYAANQFRALADRARAVHAEDDETTTDSDAERRLDQSGREQAALARLELTLRSLERDWLFLERNADPGTDPAGDAADLGLQMRILDAQEAERVRLAQEIHDGPAQTLSNAVLLVDVVERTIGRDPGQAQQELHNLRAILERELREMRGFINQLRPPLLEQLGLDGAIRDAAAQLEEGTDLRVSVDLNAPTDALSEEQQIVVLRIAQEAIRNVRKHAGASTVRVLTRISKDPRPMWILEVIDDGTGFEMQEAQAEVGGRRFGLRFMRDRAAAVGAHLDIRSAQATGTTVRLTIEASHRERA